jgi:translation initiation factor IF-3
MQSSQQSSSTPRINNQIKSPKIQLILADGTNVGVLSISDALRMAQEQGLDLIEINPKPAIPICKLLDSGKVKYEQKKKEQAAKKKQKTSEEKTLEFRPVSEEFDLSHKAKKAREFLEAGDRVRLVCKFRGREMAFRDIGLEKVNWMIEQLADCTSSSTPISVEGKDMITTLSPKNGANIK